MDLTAALPLLLPKAITWAEDQATHIALTGRALEASQIALARSVGVQRPEAIRLALVTAIPRPADPDLLRATIATGLLAADTVGLTLGHGIIVCQGHLSKRLLSHELRHVHQYEMAGSLAAFLTTYLRQIVDYGYLAAPLEIDARAHEHGY